MPITVPLDRYLTPVQVAVTRLNSRRLEMQLDHQKTLSIRVVNSSTAATDAIPSDHAVLAPVKASTTSAPHQSEDHELQEINLMQRFDTSGKRYRFFNKDCFDTDVDVYFINGILNNEAEAAASAAKLQQVMDGVLAGKFDINCNVYNIYNPTEGPVVDLLECIDLVAQQAFNIGPGKLFRFLAALAMIVAAPEVALFTALDALYPFWIQTVTKWVNDHNAVNNAQIIADAKSKIDDSISKGKKVFLVAHSQGNLYMNTIYQALDVEDRFYVSLLSVASPAPYVGLPGVTYPYVSRSDDIVVRVTVGNLPPSPVVPSHTEGKLGKFGINHDFVTMYLGDVAVGAVVRSYILAQVTLLLAPYDEGPYNKVRGSVVVEVTGYPKINYPQSARDIDIDLHIYQSTGAHLFYGNQYGSKLDGSVGFLNADVNGFAYTLNGVDYYYILFALNTATA